MHFDSENASLANSASAVPHLTMNLDEQDFEDSFNNDMSAGDMSISSKKITIGGDDDLFSHRNNPIVTR